MGHGEDQNGARQDRTRGRGRTRVVPGRKGPEGMEGGAEGAQQSRSSWRRVYTRGSQRGRVAAAAQSGHRLISSCSSRASQPVMRGWDGAHKCLLAAQVKSKALVCILGRGICNTEVFGFKLFSRNNL